MIKVLLSAFTCKPGEGSEPGYGWNWSIELAKYGCEVHCLTNLENKLFIESADFIPQNLIFHYVQVSPFFENLYSSSKIGMYSYYINWQWNAYIRAKALDSVYKFDYVHHVTWGNVQLGSFLYKLNVPFIFGPAGGGQTAPKAFKKYFLNHWNVEIKREIVGAAMYLLNPACRRMIKKSKAILVSNPETEAKVRKAGAKNTYNVLDTGLSLDFFPKNRVNKETVNGILKLLWVGRFLPRKGTLLLLDVMKRLKDYHHITLTVVGDGEMREAFLSRIEQYDLHKTVFWKGAVPHEEVKSYYKSHDVFLYTSLRESGGIQLVEAMAYSLPVITLDLHGPAIIVDNSRGMKCSCISPDEAIDSIAKAILSFYNNPQQIRQKGQAAYEYAIEQTWANKVKYVLENIYNIN